MCITKVESFEFAGKLYSTERLALEAAITEAGARLVKNHSANPGAGLMNQCSELVPLLARFCEIARQGTATEVASEKSQRGPKDRHGPKQRTPLRRGVRDHFSANNTAAVDYLQRCGFPDIDSFVQRASMSHMKHMATLLKPDSPA